MRVVLAGLVLVAIAASAGPVRAERDPENSAKQIVLAPESARPAWAWLQRVTKANDPFVDTKSRFFFARASTRVTPQSDHFASAGSGQWPAPEYATKFRFTVGSDRWGIVADPQRHLVFYGEACCSFSRQVLAAYDGPLPAGVAQHDLSATVPASGIRIGDTSATVFHALGAPVRRLTAPHSTRWAAAYSRPYDANRKFSPASNNCVEERTAVFEHDRLVAYEIYDGC